MLGNDLQLLMLDECTSGVDPVAAQKIVECLRNYHISKHELSSMEQVAMVFASHRIDECISICDKVIIIHNGYVCFQGKLSNAFTHLFHHSLMFPRIYEYIRPHHLCFLPG